MTIEEKLDALGWELPSAPAPAANYEPFVRTGDLLFVSGQISNDAQGLLVGKLGAGMSIEAGQAAARRCALNLLAQFKAATGDLERLARVVKLTGFVNSTDDFVEHPSVINGASDFLVELLGDRGRHARAAVGCSSLPLGVAVEIEAIFEVCGSEDPR